MSQCHVGFHDGKIEVHSFTRQALKSDEPFLFPFSLLTSARCRLDGARPAVAGGALAACIGLRVDSAKENHGLFILRSSHCQELEKQIAFGLFSWVLRGCFRVRDRGRVKMLSDCAMGEATASSAAGFHNWVFCQSRLRAARRMLGSSPAVSAGDK